MRGFFNMDGPVFVFLNKVADLVILNLLFILCSIPIITIGCSMTAMDYVLLKKKEGSESYLWKMFFHSFKENFKQSTIIWICMMLAAFVLYVDFRMLPQFKGPMGIALLVVVAMGAFFWLILSIYVFPLQSRFENPIRQTIKNAVLMSLANAPKTILLVVISIAAAAITLWNVYTIVWGVLFWIMIGFALIQEINTRFLHKMFEVLMPKEQEEEMTPGEFSWEKEEGFVLRRNEEAFDPESGKLIEDAGAADGDSDDMTNA